MLRYRRLLRILLSVAWLVPEGDAGPRNAAVLGLMAHRALGLTKPLSAAHQLCSVQYAFLIKLLLWEYKVNTGTSLPNTAAA